jgi:hypothetical protein
VTDGADEEPFTPTRAEVADEEPLPRRSGANPGLFTPGQWLPSSQAGEGDAAGPTGATAMGAAADEGDADDESWGPPTEALLVLDDSAEMPAVAADAPSNGADDHGGDELIDLDRERDLDEVAARLREWRASGRSSAWRDDEDDQLPGIDDPYLAELREAVRDTAPLGPREHDDRELDDDDHADKPRSGIFRRRR